MHMQGDAGDHAAGAALRRRRRARCATFSRGRAQACRGRGHRAPTRIVLDPGFGFGKTLEHNLALLRGLPQLVALGYPVLAGLSRKSIHRRHHRPRAGRAHRRQHRRGAGGRRAGRPIVRVHDVRETVDALKVWMALTG